MLKVVKETKSWLPFKAWLECLRLSKQIDSSFVYYGSLEFLEKDIKELRKQYQTETSNRLRNIQTQTKDKITINAKVDAFQKSRPHEY